MAVDGYRCPELSRGNVNCYNSGCASGIKEAEAGEDAEHLSVYRTGPQEEGISQPKALTVLRMRNNYSEWGFNVKNIISFILKIHNARIE